MPPQESEAGPSVGYITQGFPAPGLRRTVRHITGHNDDGKTVFISTDCGDHHKLMGEQQAIANILYSTRDTPVDLNDNLDVELAKEQEVSSLAMASVEQPLLLILFLLLTSIPHHFIK